MQRVDMEYIIEQLGNFIKRKDWFNFQCPYHHGESNNFGVSFKSDRFNCFNCGAHGTGAELLRDLRKGIAEGVGGSTPLLGRKIARNYEENTSPAVLKRLNEVGSPSGGVLDTDKWFRERYKSLSEASESISRTMATKYMVGRGIDLRGIEVGLLDGYEGRVVFPFYDRGKVVFFQGRNFVDQPLKTINPDVEKGWYPKTGVLFRLEKLGPSNPRVVITEGIFDALSVEKAMPRWNATCLLGKTISQKQIRLLRSAGITEVYVFLDGDANREAVELAIKLYKHKFAVKVVTYPEHMKSCDPGSMDHSLIRSTLLSAQGISPLSEVRLALEYV